MSDNTPPKDEHSKKEQYAIALSYQDIEDLPRVVASGSGEFARKLLEFAEKKGIPISEDPELAKLLKSLKAGSQISPETFRLVAEIVTFLYQVDQKFAEQHEFLEAVMEPDPIHIGSVAK